MLQNYLKRVRLAGYKSIADADIELRPLNILIGANGSGKSNLLSYFRLLNEMMGGRFQHFVAQSGFASTLLHNGPKVTKEIQFELEFASSFTKLNIEMAYKYKHNISYIDSDSLIFLNEAVCVTTAQLATLHDKYIAIDGNRRESALFGNINDTMGGKLGKILSSSVLRQTLNGCRYFHFHDTSSTSRMRLASEAGIDTKLWHDAGNLASLLHLYREHQPALYRSIVSTVRSIAPYFDDFVLEPVGVRNMLLLKWKGMYSDEPFGGHQLSDGTIRFMALATLLKQTEPKWLPSLIVIDEPELGLHPGALSWLAEMLKTASKRTQVIVATQSTNLIDMMDPADVIVVDQVEGKSQFNRPNLEEYAEWLEKYTLGDLVKMNHFAGPKR